MLSVVTLSVGGREVFGTCRRVLGSCVVFLLARLSESDEALVQLGVVRGDSEGTLDGLKHQQRFTCNSAIPKECCLFSTIFLHQAAP